MENNNVFTLQVYLNSLLRDKKDFQGLIDEDGEYLYFQYNAKDGEYNICVYSNADSLKVWHKDFTHQDLCDAINRKTLVKISDMDDKEKECLEKDVINFLTKHSIYMD